MMLAVGSVVIGTPPTTPASPATSCVAVNIDAAQASVATPLRHNVSRVFRRRMRRDRVERFTESVMAGHFPTC
ncbi:hypothetical protein [Stieleria sedimenti]|uniref:hypothetical protein n=1 Tax=Stieleria sedimenti TaxID=2976331 RepID=UPI00218028B0|nr:hypothetical protein [Stieleria sedimenti]